MNKLIVTLPFALLLSSTMSYADSAEPTSEAQICITSQLSDVEKYGVTQPGLRNYVDEKGLTIYEGSYIRNILGITDELNLNPIVVKTNFDEFIKQRITGDEFTTLSPENIVAFINKNSGFLTATFNDKQNRLEIDERLPKRVDEVDGHAYCSAANLPSARPIKDKINKDVVADKAGASGVSISENAQTTIYSMRPNEQFTEAGEKTLLSDIKSAPIRQERDAPIEMPKEIQLPESKPIKNGVNKLSPLKPKDSIAKPIIGTSQKLIKSKTQNTSLEPADSSESNTYLTDYKNQDGPENKLISFTTYKDETLTNVIERFSTKSGIEVAQDSLGFKLSNVLMSDNTYTAESYIEILKLILSGKNILVSVEDSE